MSIFAAITLAAAIVLHAIILKGNLKMDQALENLRTKVEATNGVAASAVALITGLVDQLRQHAGEVDKINELADKLNAGVQPLADAVAANNPQ